MKLIDLRSDTVTRPTPAMRAAMAEAEVGDDVYGEDPTVNRLEELAAGMLGTEAAIFAASGTQSNLMALLAHCGRGDEYIVGQKAHTYRYEGGGAAVFGSIQPQPLDFGPDGTLDLEKVSEAVKPDDVHFARTRLLCLENTQDGRALPLDYLAGAHACGRKHNLKLHLDGARIFNAAVKLEVPVDEIARHFDSVSVCLSKGLGAPVGSLLCSTTGAVKEARRWRKVLGGGMRQAGVLAAAGIVALKNHVGRLKEDHAKAALLAEGLSAIDDLSVDYSAMQTNMVFVELAEAHSAGLTEHLGKRGIIISGGTRIRLVTHLDVEKNDVHRVIEAFKDFFQRKIERGVPDVGGTSPNRGGE
jgi:threonine aldolase